jgi:hypothetical protein
MWGYVVVSWSDEVSENLSVTPVTDWRLDLILTELDHEVMHSSYVVYNMV